MAQVSTALLTALLFLIFHNGYFCNTDSFLREPLQYAI